MDKDTLLDTLRDDFSEDVKLIIRECYRSTKNLEINIEDLNDRLQDLSDVDFKERPSRDDWMDLIYDLTPDIYQRLNYGHMAA